MKAKRFIFTAVLLCAVMLFAGTSFAAETKVGVLSKLNMTEQEFQNFSAALQASGRNKIFSAEHYDSLVFYDSLLSMQMALNAGDIQGMNLPEPVADYVMNVNDSYEIVAITRMVPVALALGFRKDDDPSLRNKFNEALLSMKADGALAILRAKYIDEAGVDDPEPVKFEKYDNIDTTIKVAVTGDLPPIDFIAADGTPAGFNTAVLAELAKRMKVNIQLVNIESGARAAALASKRADVVFWFEHRKGLDVQPDIPEGIVLSETYYTWNEMLCLKKK